MRVAGVRSLSAVHVLQCNVQPSTDGWPDCTERHQALLYLCYICSCFILKLLYLLVLHL